MLFHHQLIYFMLHIELKQFQKKANYLLYRQRVLPMTGFELASSGFGVLRCNPRAPRHLWQHLCVNESERGRGRVGSISYHINNYNTVSLACLRNAETWDRQIKDGCFYIWTFMLFLFVECYGSNMGFSFSGTHEYHYEALRRRYTGCTHVHGNLEVTNLNNGNVTYDLSFLSTIQVVTGYVLLGLLNVETVPLTNLRLIR